MVPTPPMVISPRATTSATRTVHAVRRLRARPVNVFRSAMRASVIEDDSLLCPLVGGSAGNDSVGHSGIRRRA
jgi:hypothetical protein